MPLAPGTKLGPYEIVAPLGAGGMGEVYRARDVKLEREVALKALPEAFASDPERIARFEREAKVLASLHHPRIAAIYGLHEHDAMRFLAMELVPGEDLAHRLARGPLSLDDALRVATGIAEGLEAAHEQGIVHRDLKPANVQLSPDGGVKVLDFGLAKLDSMASGAQGPSSDPSLSPTLTTPATMAGVVLGTAAYMSPEQARGATTVDRRADVWALGCVLYEMVTGKRAFDGETVSDTIASVLRSEPDWGALAGNAPPAIVEISRRCLRKDARRRTQSIGDVRIALEEAASGASGALAEDAPGGTGAATRPRGRARLARLAPWLIAAVCALALAVTVARRRDRAAPAAPSLRVSVDVAGGHDFPSEMGPAVVISPDGAAIAYVAGFGQSHRLFIRRLDEQTPTVVDGMEGARSPFFSPDGKWVGVHTREALYKVPVAGGTPVRICDMREPRGATWLEDGTIVVAPHTETGLHRVSADGGEITPLTTLSAGENERTHRWPFALPGGAVLFMSQRRGENYDDAAIKVWVPRSGEVKTLVHGGSAPRWARSGHLLYVRQGTLFAVPFDLKRLETIGPAAAVQSGVLSRTGDQTSGDGSAEYCVDQRGTLVFRADDQIGGANLSRIVLVDRRGNVQRAISDPQGFSCPRVSPDGGRVAACVSAGANGVPNLWVYDIEQGTPTRLTFDKRAVTNVTWTPDGRYLMHTVEPQSVVVRRADGIGAEQLLYEWNDDYLWPYSIAPDGRTVAAHKLSKTTNWDVVLISLKRDAADRFTTGPPTVFASSPAIEWVPAISPDGRWLAYVSTESGRNEVYVQSITPGVAKWQVSWEGGNYPRWARSGGEIFFQNGDAMLSARVLRTADGLSFEKPVELFRGDFVDPTPFPGYDVAAGDDGFIMLQADSPSSADRSHVTLVTNWFDEIARAAPARK
jgi:serine/threonine-protein kinase